MRDAALRLDLFWAQTLGDPRIRIAVLDGPIDRSHPCFAGARLEHLPTTSESACGEGPASIHGTHVARLP